MSEQPFVHLHCHSHYSVLDGAARVQDLVGQAKSLGMNALALTDHGNLFGAIEFYETCKAKGLNPIVGYEAYVAPAARTDRQTRGGGDEASFHLTMLAKNRQGFQNLVKLASAAYLEGFYYKPRIDKELLEAHHEGLIVLSGCASSEFSSLILGDRLDEAAKLAEWYAKLLGDGRFFIEIQDNGLELQRQCASGAIEVANRLGLPLVATCDTHYICSADAEAHEVLLCINTGKTMSDPRRLRYGSNEFYLKSPDEMYSAFREHADAVKRSQEIADSVAIDLDFTTRHFPVFHPPPGRTDREYLRELCQQGLKRRFPDGASQEALDRVELELGVIEKLGFASYFLIVWDFVNFSAEKGIPCGARGSACGALVSYLLGFSNVDPLEHDLLFERFLDPNRAEAPDIDIDFCQRRRDEVIEYVRQKYGEKNVCQIITFGTMAARAAIRDVGRALEIPLPRVDQIAKMVPTVLSITLEEALQQSPELAREYQNDPLITRLIDIAKRLEGLARNAGTHAAGVVVADQDLSNFVPLQKNGEIVTTQWEMSVLEKVGMLKVDFLGLRNLTVLTAAVDLIEKVHGNRIDLLTIPMNDAKTYGLLQRGETKGVFQLESEGIRSLLVRMKPDRFNDLIATNALYRPGPLGGGMVDKYINVKHGRERAEYAHPLMKDVLEETYGVMVYQEQVMRILNRLGDIELADAYKCIKAISKKKLEIIDKNRAQFVEGGFKKGLPRDKSEEIFGLIVHFAGYGFNKSHSAAYALVAYQTAYLKAHYPAEFMAALLSSELDSTERLVEHLDDCRRMGLEVKPPDVNTGDVGFCVVDGVIRFGLAAIKGVGERAIEHVVTQRTAKGRYRGLYDFCERVDSRLINKGCLEALIKGGAFDGFGAKRSQMVEAMAGAMQSGVRARDARASGQGMLFGGDEPASEDAQRDVENFPDIPEWPDQEKLGYERALLGFYLSDHPLSQHESLLRIYRTHELAQLADLPERSEIVVGGMISGLRKMTQQKGRGANRQYARFAFEDSASSVGCVMFADAYAEYSGTLVNDVVCFLRAEVDKSRDEVGLIAQEVISLESAPKILSGALLVRLDASLHGEETINQLAGVLKNRPGNSNVYLELLTVERLRVRLQVGAEFCVTFDKELADRIEHVLGAGRIAVLPARAKSSRPAGQNGDRRKSYSTR